MSPDPDGGDIVNKDGIICLCWCSNNNVSITKQRIKYLAQGYYSVTPVGVKLTTLSS